MYRKTKPVELPIVFVGAILHLYLKLLIKSVFQQNMWINTYKGFLDKIQEHD